MSLREIIFRAAEQIRIRVERKTYAQTLNMVNNAEFDFFSGHTFLDAYKSGRIKELLTQPGFARKISPLLDSRRRETFLKDYPQETAETIRRADAFLEHRFSFLGVSFQLPDDIPWQSDPVSLNPYSTGFYRDIDIFTNDSAGDVKHVWEVNRLQFLIEIAKAYYLSGDEKYRQKLEFFICDWNKKNPYKTGIAWASALEVGVRVLALIWTLNFYLAGKKQDNEILALLLKLIYLHGAFLNDNLSVYFSPYNHLIGETAGLFAVGYLFPGFKNAVQWQRKAWRILTEHIHKQFHPDGGSVEQATFYHHFTLGFFIQSVALRKVNGDALPQDMMQSLEKALEFAMILTRPDGTLPYMGDIDDARSIYFSDPTNWNFKSYQSIGAAWFDRPDMKYVAGKFGEDAFWLLTSGDEKRYDALPARPSEQKTFFLEQTGYAVFRNGFDAESHFSFMDCGPLADGVFYDETPSAAHGHADLLSIELAPYGESLLIDPGFSNYRGDFNWHAYFRSTAAHNTIEIDGRSQAEQGGILVWSHAPQFKVLQKTHTKNISAVCAEQYGYRRLTDKPVHRRCFLWVDRAFWLTMDWIYSAEASADQEHELAYYLHFNEYVEIQKQGEPTQLWAKGQQSALHIYSFSDDAGSAKITSVKGGNGPQQGWISPTYRAVRPAPLIKIEYKSKLPLTLLTLFLPEKTARSNNWRVVETPNEILLRQEKSEYGILFKEGSLTIYKENEQLFFVEKH